MTNRFEDDDEYRPDGHPSTWSDAEITKWIEKKNERYWNSDEGIWTSYQIMIEIVDPNKRVSFEEYERSVKIGLKKPPPS